LRNNTYRGVIEVLLAFLHKTPLFHAFLKMNFDAYFRPTVCTKEEKRRRGEVQYARGSYLSLVLLGRGWR
jgi:hypothetical protein